MFKSILITIMLISSVQANIFAIMAERMIKNSEKTAIKSEEHLISETALNTVGNISQDSSISEYINKSNCDQIIDKQVFTICYDYKNKSAKFVGYTLDGSLVNSTNIKERNKFYTESNLPSQYRSKNADYNGIGYDRGHLANDADFDYSSDSVVKTYSMANIVPQSPNLNRKVWIKSEKLEREVASKLGSVSVINAVVYSNNPPVVGKSKLKIPSYFYKMIYNKDKNYQKCFYYENEMPIFDNKGEIIVGFYANPINVSNDNLGEHQVDCSRFPRH